jgi:hypothetical protein
MTNVPPHWVKGQLLDLMRFGDGTYRAIALGEEPSPELANFIDFPSAHEAQSFISAWYQPDRQRFN